MTLYCPEELRFVSLVSESRRRTMFARMYVQELAFGAMLNVSTGPRIVDFFTSGYMQALWTLFLIFFFICRENKILTLLHVRGTMLL